MYYTPYEDYMQNGVNYSVNPMMNGKELYENENTFTYDERNIEGLYPNIYRIVYPMVCKACMYIQENITEELVGKLTEEIYQNIEKDESVQENRNAVGNTSAQIGKAIRVDNQNPKIVSQENRNRTPLLKDLIRILVLRELVGRPPYRPPMLPPRPPFGGPGPNYPPMPGQGMPRPEPRSPYAF